MAAAISLYRRHRPQAFDEVVGQQHVVRTLRNAVEQGRVHHAYLFVGSRGTGKTSMAKILARSLNCVEGPTSTPCGKCDPCREIAAGSSFDVIEMDAASNRSVDDVRELRERVAYAPAASRWKVYILDEAHMLTKEAWNAFLKTLEDPPPNTVFVLATTEAHKVMPTIADRCQRFDFQRPSLEQIAEVLQRVAEAEGIEVADPAVALISRAAQGSFRDALGTLDQLVAFGGDRVELDAVLELLGAPDAELLFEAVDGVAAADPRGVLATVERLATSGRDPTQFARDLLTHLRHLLVVRMTGEVPSSFSVTATDEDRLRAQASCLGEAQLVRTVDELAASITAIREGDEARLAVEVALLKAARPDLDPSTEGLLRRLERLETGSTEAPSDRPGSDPAAPGVADEEAAGSDVDERGERSGAGIRREPSEDVVDLDRILSLWPAIVDQVRQSGSAMVSALFEGARPVAVDQEQSTLRIGFPTSATFNKRKAEAKEHQERFAEALRTIVGERLRPVYVLLDGESDSDETASGAELDEDQLLERLKAEFDAEELKEDVG